MQRGTRITLAVAILLAGAAAAMMFRREKSTGDSAAAATAESAPLKNLAGTSASAPHLTGRIESSDHAQPSTGPIEVPTSPLAVVPTAAVLPRENHFFAEDSGVDGSEMAKTHKVRDGDTLSELARRYLGRRERFMEIFEANRDKLTSPDLLPIGKELRIPSVGQNSSWHTASPAEGTVSPEYAPPQPAEPGGIAPEPTASLGVIRHINGPTRPPRIYRVGDEQTLVQVAERVYGNAARYRDLYDANRDRLDSPQNLRPGMILFVP